jgi:hypothetical protein
MGETGKGQHGVDVEGCETDGLERTEGNGVGYFGLEL